MKNTLDRTPPELAADVRDNGIVLTGGALLHGMVERACSTTPVCRSPGGPAA